MELIQIIYTVLKIVAVLTIITIGTSYAVYKFRQKKGVEDSSIKTVAKPAIKIENIVKKVELRITKPLHFQVKPEQIQSKPVKKEQPKPEIEKVKIDQKKKEIKNYRTEKEKIKNERIEIVKNLTSKNKPIELPTTETKEGKKLSTKEEIKLNTLGDQIIDKYIDEEDKEFYTLNVKDKKSKK